MLLGSSRWAVVAARGDVETPSGKFQLEFGNPLENASSDRLGLFDGYGHDNDSPKLPCVFSGGGRQHWIYLFVKVSAWRGS
ncbi:hypothetical protein ABIB80_004160 [Bradyrhizobium sp. i1.15.2]